MNEKSIKFSTALLIRYHNLIDEDPEYISEVLHADGEDDKNYNKLMSAIHIVKSNFYWRNLQQFSILSNSITYGIIHPFLTTLTSTEAIGWAVVEVSLISPDFGETDFTDDIKEYIRQLVRYERDCPFTLIPFIGKELAEKYENNVTNNWIVDRMHDLIKQIKHEFEARGEKLNVSSLSDMEKRLSIFNVQI